MSNQYSKKHGFFGTKTYWVWHNMKQRCLNVNHEQYVDYGARGIGVCDKWLDFRGFLEDMGEQPEKMSLDRINNNGNYEPSNCRWVSAKIQAQNRRNTKLTADQVEIIREVYQAGGASQKALAKEYGVSRSTISHVVLGRVW